MIKISFLTIYPDAIAAYIKTPPWSQAIKKHAIACNIINLRDFAIDKHGSVDDRPYGGGDGMVMRADVLARALCSLGPVNEVMLTSPQGLPWTQVLAEQKAQKWMDQQPYHVAMVCGRFAGVDQRFIDKYVTDNLSLGPYVFSGGELGGFIILESIIRLLPHVLGNPLSHQMDSFSPQLNRRTEFPLYTRPHDFEGILVPSELLSGDAQKITQWRQKQIKNAPWPFFKDTATE